MTKLERKTVSAKKIWVKVDKGVGLMCNFKYRLSDKAYLKTQCADIPLGSDVTIMGRVNRDGINTYTVAEGTFGIDKSDNIAKGVREDQLSDRPPFEEIYVVRAEIMDCRVIKQDFIFEKVIFGNLDEAVRQFDTLIDTCEEEFKLRKKFGKCTLFIPTITDKGLISSFIDDDKILRQKFFIERA